MLMLVQVLFLLISTPSFSSAHGAGAGVGLWLNTPENMNMVWELSKMIFHKLPSPKNMDELEEMTRKSGDVIRKKIEIFKALNMGYHPRISLRLGKLGMSPDKGVLTRLLDFQSIQHLDKLMKKEGI